MKKLPPVLAGVIVAGIVVGVLAGVGRLPVLSQEEGPASGQLRWLNVVVDLPPENSPLRVRRDMPHGPEKPRWLIQIYVERELTPGAEPRSQMLEIDADTGEVATDTLTAAISDQAVSGQLSSVLDSVRIDTGPPEVWPYVDETPRPPEPAKWGNLAIIIPDPASGIVVSPATSDCLASATKCFPQWLGVFDGHSQMGIDAETGQIISLDRVTAEDMEAFERYAATVQVTGAAQGGTP